MKMIRHERRTMQVTELSLRVVFILSVILDQANRKLRMSLHFEGMPFECVLYSSFIAVVAHCCR
jgi:hypothetical protein